MYESFFGMRHTPFSNGIPTAALYTSREMEQAFGRLAR